MATVEVGNVVISLMVFGDSGTPNPALTMARLAHIAVSKVTLLFSPAAVLAAIRNAPGQAEGVTAKLIRQSLPVVGAK